MLGDTGMSYARVDHTFDGARRRTTRSIFVFVVCYRNFIRRRLCHHHTVRTMFFLLNARKFCGIIPSAVECRINGRVLFIFSNRQCKASAKIDTGTVENKHKVIPSAGPVDFCTKRCYSRSYSRDSRPLCAPEAYILDQNRLLEIQASIHLPCYRIAICI